MVSTGFLNLKPSRETTAVRREGRGGPASRSCGRQNELRAEATTEIARNDLDESRDLCRPDCDRDHHSNLLPQACRYRGSARNPRCLIRRLALGAGSLAGARVVVTGERVKARSQRRIICHSLGMAAGRDASAVDRSTNWPQPQF